MIINEANVRGAYESFNTVFNKAFQETAVQYPRVAMEVPSETRDETYAWLGGVPSLREWIGSRQVKSLSAYGYTLANKDFELTVSVPRNDMEDDRIGVYRPLFQDLAYRAKCHPDELVFSLFSQAFEEKCFDGKPFISDKHPGPHGKAQSNKGVYKLSPESYGAARTQIMTIQDEEGNSMKIIPDLLVVSPQNEAVAKSILLADEVNKTVNIYKGTAELLVVPELADHPDQWFLLCTKRYIKPFIFQTRSKPRLIPKDKPEDNNVFFQKEYLYGVDYRGNAGYGLWQLAFGSTGETVMPAKL